MDPDLEGHSVAGPSNHQGKIIRLHDDGRVPTDNPFVGQAGNAPEIWSWGHRNPQGLAVHPETGELWATEHGPQGGDELNWIRRGANYGWPVIGYGANYVLGTEIHKDRYKAGMEQPQAFWVPSIGISGLVFYTGDKFPNWKGNAFVGGMSGNFQQLVRVVVEWADGHQPRAAARRPIPNTRRAPGARRLPLSRDRQHLQPADADPAARAGGELGPLSRGREHRAEKTTDTAEPRPRRARTKAARASAGDRRAAAETTRRCGEPSRHRTVTALPRSPRG